MITHIKVGREYHHIIDSIRQQHRAKHHKVHLGLGRLVKLLLEGQQVEMADERQAAVGEHSDDVTSRGRGHVHRAVIGHIVMGNARVDEDGLDGD